MIGVESVLTKIALVLLKKATAHTAFALVGKAIEVYSVFDTIRDAAHVLQTTSDCRKSRTYGLRVLAEKVSDRVIDKLLNVGGTTYEVRQTSDGIFVASNLAPTFQIAPPPKPPADKDKLRRLIAAYEQGERGPYGMASMELLNAVKSGQVKMNVFEISLGGGRRPWRRTTFTLDDGAEFTVDDDPDEYRVEISSDGLRMWRV